ncbi:MAG: hypothetical protein ACI9O4_001954 [Chitinophagales bacterium]
MLKTDNFPFQLHIVQELKKLEQVALKTSNQQVIDQIIAECNELLKNDTGSKMMKAIELSAIVLLALSQAFYH